MDEFPICSRSNCILHESFGTTYWYLLPGDLIQSDTRGGTCFKYRSRAVTTPGQVDHFLLCMQHNESPELLLILLERDGLLQ